MPTLRFVRLDRRVLFVEVDNELELQLIPAFRAVRFPQARRMTPRRAVESGHDGEGMALRGRRRAVLLFVPDRLRSSKGRR